MKELLYIDGQAVDLGGKVDITLNYKSNLLTDLGKIVGNNSYTIKLPKTKRNLGIIGVSDIPSVVTTFPRTYHEARYFRNGVEIVSDGKAVLLSVGDDIEMAMVWGGAAALSRIVEDEKMLTELEGFTDYVDWNWLTSVSVYNGTDDIMFPNIELNAKPNVVPIHPAVRSTYILKALKEYYNLSVVFPPEHEEFINTLIFPLLTRNGGYANRISNMGGYKNHESYGGELFDKIGDAFDSIFEVKYGTGAQAGKIQYYKVLQDCNVVITPNFGSWNIGAYVAYGSDNTDNTIYFPYDIKKNEESTVFPYIYVYNKPVEIELKANDIFYIRVVYPVVVNQTGYLYTFGAQPEEVKVNDKFPIIENLPEIKVIDFIKALAAITGLFVIPSSDGNTLNFVPFDTFSDKSKALDWSDKVVTSYRESRPMNIGYSLDGFARNNRMEYTEDETVATWANASIVVDDVTLDFERQAVVLPFAPSDSFANRAAINLYKYDDEGQPELQEVKPRILIEKNVNGYSTGTFDGLHWASLVANYYNTYQNAVKSPVVITERIMLGDITIRDLDVSTPVYLRQYGKYYAIIEVKVPSEGACECKLLQLD